MTKKEENQQSLNIKFKLKLIKIKEPLKLGKGIYEQMGNRNITYYNRGEFKLDVLKEAFAEAFNKKQK